MCSANSFISLLPMALSFFGLTVVMQCSAVILTKADLVIVFFCASAYMFICFVFVVVLIRVLAYAVL